MLIYVIRHGEYLLECPAETAGPPGADLDEKGVRLAEITGEALKDVPFDICYTSPLIRARHTAEILLKGREIPIILEPRIMEIGFGEWEGPLLRSGADGDAGGGVSEILQGSLPLRSASRRGEYPAGL